MKEIEYDSDVKDSYRRQVWNAIEKNWANPSRGDRRVLILDTRDALETLFLIKRGYRPENIHVINREAVEVALLTRKLESLGFRRVNTYGVAFSDAVPRLKKCNLDAVNLDFCANASDHLLDWLCDARVIVRDNTVVALNMLAGREADPWKATYESMLRRGVPEESAGTFARLRLALATLSGAIGDEVASCVLHFSNLVYRKYVSTSGQPMLWFVTKAISHGTAVKDRSHCSALCRDARIGGDGFTEKHLTNPICVVYVSAMTGGTAQLSDLSKALQFMGLRSTRGEAMFIQVKGPKVEDCKKRIAEIGAIGMTEKRKRYIDKDKQRYSDLTFGGKSVDAAFRESIQDAIGGAA